MDEARPKQTDPRKERIPLGTGRQKLVTDRFLNPGKVQRWINDDPGRIAQALEGGYTFVTDPNAKVGEGPENQRDRNTAHICRGVGSRKGGGTKKAYLMEIDRDLYEADQREKARAIDETERTIKRGEIAGRKFGTDGQYDTDIKIEHGISKGS